MFSEFFGEQIEILGNLFELVIAAERDLLVEGAVSKIRDLAADWNHRAKNPM